MQESIFFLSKQDINCTFFSVTPKGAATKSATLNDGLPNRSLFHPIHKEEKKPDLTDELNLLIRKVKSEGRELKILNCASHIQINFMFMQLIICFRYE